MNYVSVGAVLGAVLLGWLAGVLTFKRSSRWCPQHGITLRCQLCVGPLTAKEPAASSVDTTRSQVERDG